jgi:hypothetical protein
MWLDINFMIYFWHVILTGENELMGFEDWMLRKVRGNKLLAKNAYRGASCSVVLREVSGDLIRRDDMVLALC